MQRHGAWRGPVRGRHAVLLHRRVRQGRAEGPARRARRHRRLARAQPEEGVDAGRRRTSTRWPACCSSTRPSARCCCTARWRATSATCAACWSSSRSAARRRPMPRSPRWPASTSSEVAEALRAGSRLERIGMVENLISEHNITDLADLMKVSEQLPPVLMREYQGPRDLMAVFTRPASAQRADAGDFHFRRRRRAGADHAAAQCRARARSRRQRAAVRPAGHRQDRAGQGLRAGRAGSSCTRWSTPTATATRCPAATATARCRSARCS